MNYVCSICGETHSDLPHIGTKAPYYWTDALVGDPDSLLTEDLCIIEGRDYFVRGVIEVPVHDHEPGFGWGVWVSHKRENFEAYRSNFDARKIGPFFGWLSTAIAYYAEPTLNLKSMAHYRGDRLRPAIVLDESDHPLCRHQREGISLEEAWRMVHHYSQGSGLDNESVG